MENEVVTSSR